MSRAGAPRAERGGLTNATSRATAERVTKEHKLRDVLFHAKPERPKRGEAFRTEHKARGVIPLRASVENVHELRVAGDVPSRKASPRLRSFRETVWDYWKKSGRHDLPWRHTYDPYKILVSEMMLQQTQIERVIPFYKNFLKRFPTARALAKAPLADVLKQWNGLGYNRRAKYLHETAKLMMLSSSYSGNIAYEDLRAFPGVGDYTAKAVRVFAYNEPEVLIETNIRTVFIHHFFPHTPEVHDRQILVYAGKVMPKSSSPVGGSREWHWALMDYGAHIKKIHRNPSRRSAHYARQSKFQGSLRQVRGAILRARLHDAPMNDVRRRYPDLFDAALVSLVRDGLMDM